MQAGGGVGVWPYTCPTATHIKPMRTLPSSPEYSQSELSKCSKSTNLNVIFWNTFWQQSPQIQIQGRSLGTQSQTQTSSPTVKNPGFASACASNGWEHRVEPEAQTYISLKLIKLHLHPASHICYHFYRATTCLRDISSGSVSVCLSVCHTPVVHRNACADQAECRFRTVLDLSFCSILKETWIVPFATLFQVSYSNSCSIISLIYHLYIPR